MYLFPRGTHEPIRETSANSSGLTRVGILRSAIRKTTPVGRGPAEALGTHSAVQEVSRYYTTRRLITVLRRRQPGLDQLNQLLHIIFLWYHFNSILPYTAGFQKFSFFEPRLPKFYVQLLFLPSMLLSHIIKPSPFSHIFNGDYGMKVNTPGR